MMRRSTSPLPMGPRSAVFAILATLTLGCGFAAAAEPETWETFEVGTPLSELPPWSPAGSAPPSEGSIEGEADRRLVLDPRKSSGGGDVLIAMSEMTASATWTLEAHVEIEFLDGPAGNSGGDVLLMLSDTAAGARYQLNLAPDQAMLGILRVDGSFESTPIESVPIARGDHPVDLRLRLQIGSDGGHRFEIFVNDQDTPVLVRDLPRDGSPAPLSFAGRVRLGVGVQAGYAAAFDDLLLESARSDN